MPNYPKTPDDSPEALKADINTLTRVVVKQANEIMWLRSVLEERVKWSQPETQDGYPP